MLSPFLFIIFDYTVLILHNKMFRVEAIFQVGSGNLKQTYMFRPYNLLTNLSLSISRVLKRKQMIKCSFKSIRLPKASHCL